MEYLVLAIQIVICVTSCVMADYMVTHRTGLAKRLNIGRDSSADISEMRKLAVAAFEEKKEEDTKLKNYTISTTVENGKITKTVIETKKTMLIYTEKDEDEIIHKGITEKGAIINDTLLLIVVMDIIFILCLSVNFL